MPPGTAATMARSKTEAIPTSGLMLTALGQLFAMLVFTVFVVESMRSYLGGTDDLLRLLPWTAAWIVAGQPGWMALKDGVSANPRTVQHAAATVSTPLASLSFFTFVFIPDAVEWGFAWVPHL